MYGAIYRPTHRNGPWDAARFEGCAHRWGDISEPGFGVALLNDGKYGYEALGTNLMISLLRSPLYPDPLADEGAHHFTYSVLPHAGDWSESNVVQEAFSLNSPLVVTTGDARPGFVVAHGLPLGIGALKRAEDGNGLILRVYEPHGARGATILHFARPMRAVTSVNLLEDPVDDEANIQVDGPKLVTLDFRPFEVKSLRLIPA
jgi:alpha-mannosidase